MQKTFNVWVKRNRGGFNVCSKKVGHDVDELMEINSTHTGIIDDGAEIKECDVSQWLETLELGMEEVIEGQITFKFKNK